METTKLNHTKGNWTYGTYVNAKGQGSIPTEIRSSGIPYGRLIADLNFDTTDTELSSDKVLANAKLIAAAPEMLEALEHYIDMEKAFHGEMLVSFRPITEMIKSAIEKATINQ